MNSKVITVTKKVIQKVPNRAIEAGAALLIGKTLKSNRTVVKLVTAVAVVVVANVISDWASKE